MHLDRCGLGENISVKGTYKGIGLWNAYLTLKLSRKNELLNLHAGYIWTAISREFITTSWTVGSLDKTNANRILRNFISGKSNGIEGGLAIGGLKNFENYGLNYRIGAYVPSTYFNPKNSNLFTCRVMLSIGTPEQSEYNYMLSGHSWMKRKGISIGVGGGTQFKGITSDTIIFKYSQSYGADILIDYYNFSLDGEYFIMRRKADDYKNFKGEAWHTWIGYNFILRNMHFEYCISYDIYKGKGKKILFSKIGYEETLDTGINWYINRDKLKLALHYIFQKGTISYTGDYLALAFTYKL